MGTRDGRKSTPWWACRCGQRLWASAAFCQACGAKAPAWTASWHAGGGNAHSPAPKQQASTPQARAADGTHPTQAVPLESWVVQPKGRRAQRKAAGHAAAAARGSTAPGSPGNEGTGGAHPPTALPTQGSGDGMACDAGSEAGDDPAAAATALSDAEAQLAALRALPLQSPEVQAMVAEQCALVERRRAAMAAAWPWKGLQKAAQQLKRKQAQLGKAQARTADLRAEATRASAAVESADQAVDAHLAHIDDLTKELEEQKAAAQKGGAGLPAHPQQVDEQLALHVLGSIKAHVLGLATATPAAPLHQALDLFERSFVALRDVVQQSAQLSVPGTPGMAALPAATTPLQPTQVLTPATQLKRRQRQPSTSPEDATKSRSRGRRMPDDLGEADTMAGLPPQCYDIASDPDLRRW